MATRNAARKKSIRVRTSSAYLRIAAILQSGDPFDLARQDDPHACGFATRGLPPPNSQTPVAVMHKPIAKPVDPAEVGNLARELMRAAKFPVLATIDGDQPRVRPV